MIWLVIGLGVGFAGSLVGWIGTALRLEERKYDIAFWRQRTHAAETHSAAIVHQALENMPPEAEVVEAVADAQQRNVLKK